MSFEPFIDRTRAFSCVSLGRCDILRKYDSENAILRENDVIAGEVYASITTHNAFAYTSGGGWEYASDRFKVSARIVGFSIRASAVEDTCLLPGFLLVDYERTIGKSSVAIDRNRVASH